MSSTTPRGRDGEPLSDTTVSLHLEQPHESGRNLLWCVTSELALARIERVLGGPPRFTTPRDDASELLEALARSRVATDAIDERFYVAAAGRWSAALDAAIHAECREKFDAPAAGLEPAPGLFTYCQLRATVLFERPLDRHAEPLEFAGDLVHNFGLTQFAKDDPRLESVVVHAPYHDQPDEVWARGWIVELLVAPRRARVIVARVAKPGATLRETVDDVLARLRPDARDHKDSWLDTRESLEIPVVDIELTRALPELTGRALANEGFVGERFERGVHGVTFRLDESGADLKSTFMLGGFSGRLRSFKVDGPFLVLMLQRAGDVPLMAAWIETAELLERASKFRVPCPEPGGGAPSRPLDLEAVADKLARQRPREVEVHGGEATDELIRVIARASHVFPIEELRVDGVTVTGDALRPLVDGDWRQLRHLYFNYRDEGVWFDEPGQLGEALAACSLPRLESLTLWRGHVGDARALLASLPDTLTCLFLHRASALAGGPEMFADVERFPSLARLLVEHETLSDAWLEALLERVTPALTHLRLRCRALTDASARALARCAALRGLELLELRCAAITDEGVIALAGASQLAGLRRLDLSDTALTDEGVISLAGAPQLAGLERLDLPFRRIGARGYAALEASPYITHWLPPRR